MWSQGGVVDRWPSGTLRFGLPAYVLTGETLDLSKAATVVPPAATDTDRCEGQVSLSSRFRFPGRSALAHLLLHLPEELHVDHRIPLGAQMSQDGRVGDENRAFFPGVDPCRS